jgi:restriction system protein
LTILKGVPKASVISMRNAIFDQTGTPQNPVDWSDPDAWIPERLSGDEEALARRIWEESDRTMNPRHTSGAYLFINGHDLLVPDGSGVYSLTERGRAFLDELALCPRN